MQEMRHIMDNAKKSKSVIFSFILSIVALIAELIMYIFCGTAPGISLIIGCVWFVFSVIRLFLRNPSSPVMHIIKTLIILIVFAIALLISPATSNSKHAFQYDYVKIYHNIYHEDTSFFPDALPEDVHDYHFYWFTGFLQADPLKYLMFVTSENEIAKIISDAESRAFCKLDYAEYIKDPNNSEVKKFSEENNNKSIFVATGEFGEYCDTGDIYVVKTDGNWNHHNSECIIINKEKCVVSYVMQG